MGQISIFCQATYRQGRGLGGMGEMGGGVILHYYSSLLQFNCFAQLMSYHLQLIKKHFPLFSFFSLALLTSKVQQSMYLHPIPTPALKLRFLVASFPHRSPPTPPHAFSSRILVFFSTVLFPHRLDVRPVEPKARLSHRTSLSYRLV